MKIAAGGDGTVYTLTGTSSPGLLTFNENTLAPTGGVNQNQEGGSDGLAFDENGRLFANTNAGLFEFNPVTLAVIDHATGGGSRIAVRNGTIYTLTGTSSPGLLTLNENTLAPTGGVNQDQEGGPDSLAFDENGRLFANSNAGLLEFNPITLAVIDHGSPGSGAGIAVSSSIAPEPSVSALVGIAFGMMAFSRRRR